MQDLVKATCAWNEKHHTTCTYQICQKS